METRVWLLIPPFTSYMTLRPLVIPSTLICPGPVFRFIKWKSHPTSETYAEGLV